MQTPTRAQLPPLPKGIRLLTNVESQNLNRRSQIASAYTPDRCVTCKGRKWFLWRDTRTGQPTEYDCPCPDQYMLFRMLLHSGIPLAYQRLGWSDYSHLDPKVVDDVGRYIENRDRFIDAGFGMVLHGSRGNGKTLLANLLLKEMVADGIPCYATTFDDLVEAFAGGWRDPEQERWFNQTVRSARVLYVDDVGREYAKDRFGSAKLSEEERRTKAMADNRPGSMKETLLESVVRHRVGNCLPTFVSTNFTPEQITTGYGGHTMSLLSEKSILVEVTGADRRNKIRLREEQFVIDGLSRPIVIDGIGAL